MSINSEEIIYKCNHDCKSTGCPSHEAKIKYHGTSDIYEIIMPNELGKNSLLISAGAMDAIVKLYNKLQ